MEAISYDEPHRISRSKFTMQKSLELKELAKDTVVLTATPILLLSRLVSNAKSASNF